MPIENQNTAVEMGELSEATIIAGSVNAIQRLTFSGGGAKGVVYPGAFRALVDTGIFDTVREVSGASAGSIVASMIAAGMQVDMIRDKLLQINFLNLLGKRVGSMFGNPDGVLYPTKDGVPLLNYIRLSVFESVQKFFTEIDSQALPEEVLPIFEKMKQENPLPSFTFRDLAVLSEHYPLRFKKLTMTAVRASDCGLQVFNSDLTPDVDIALASRASSSIPLFFEPVAIEIDGKVERYMDGGYYDNNPTEYFDKDENNPKGFKPNQKKDATLLFSFIANKDAVPNALFRALHAGRWDEYLADKPFLVEAIIEAACDTHLMLLDKKQKRSKDVLALFNVNLKTILERNVAGLSDEETKDKEIIVSKISALMVQLMPDLLSNKNLFQWMGSSGLEQDAIDDKIALLSQFILSYLKPEIFRANWTERFKHSDIVKKVGGINADYDALELKREGYQKICKKYTLRTVGLYVGPVSTLSFDLATSLARTIDSLGYLDTINFATSHNLHNPEQFDSGAFYNEVVDNFYKIYRAVLLGAGKNIEKDGLYLELVALRAQLAKRRETISQELASIDETIKTEGGHDLLDKRRALRAELANDATVVMNRQCCQLIKDKVEAQIDGLATFALVRAVEFSNVDRKITAEQLMKETYEQARNLAGYKPVEANISFDLIDLSVKSFNVQLHTVFNTLKKIEKFNSDYLNYRELHQQERFDASHAKYALLLAEFKVKVDDLKDKAKPSFFQNHLKYIEAHAKADELYQQLDKLGSAYFNDERYFEDNATKIEKLQEGCVLAINNALPELQAHRCNELIDALRRFIYWLVNLFAVVPFPKTDSERKVIALKKGIDEVIEINQEPAEQTPSCH